MKRQIIAQANTPEWKAFKTRYVSSTEISALLGLSKWVTKYELWHRKKDQIDIDIEENARMFWGTKLEPAIAAGVAEDNGWKIRPMKEFIVIDDIKGAASFDYCIQSDDGQDFAVLEIKNVDGLMFKKEWLTDELGNIEAPPSIEIQVQWQMLISGLNVAYIAALVGGNEIKIIRRERDDGVIERLRLELKMFWSSIDNDSPPQPDFDRDAEFITSLYQKTEPGSVMNAYGMTELSRLVLIYKEAGELAKAYEKRKQVAKAQLLTMIGSYEKVKGEGFSISAGPIGPSTISYERQGYRDFRCYLRKDD